MTKIHYGLYEIRTFCSKCRHDFGEPAFGNIWFIQKHYPVCPNCGSHYTAYVNETGRYCYTRKFIFSKSWWEKKNDVI